MTSKEKASKLWDELFAKWRWTPAKDLSHGYWVSEWSWQPICDGVFPTFHEKIPYFKFVDGLCFYVSNTNNRVYAQWDLCGTEEECKKLCDEKNQCGYEWDILYNKMLKGYALNSGIGMAHYFGWFKQVENYHRNP